MDKKTIVAFVLIGLILVFTQTKFYREEILKLPPRSEITAVQPDSAGANAPRETVTKVASPKGTSVTTERKERHVFEDENEIKQEVNPLKKILQKKQEGEYEDVVVETDNYIAHLSPRGAVVTKWELKKYTIKNNNENVQLIDNNGYGNLGLFFINDEDTIYTYDAIFTPDKRLIRFEGGKDHESVKFVLDLGDNQQLVKTFTFYRDEYIFDLDIEIKELATKFDDYQYFLAWPSGLKYTEYDYSNLISKEDVTNSRAIVYQGGSREELKLPNKPFQKKSRTDFSGIVDWAAIRTKYFSMIILPDNEFEIEPELYGETLPLYKDPKLKDRVKKNYSVILKTKIPPSEDFHEIHQHFRVYLGPLDYFVIKKYHPTLGKIMDFGMALIRPFAKFVLQSFIFLHKFIPNYGVVLIIFAIIIKILVWPLTRKSYASMHKMQTLQPKLNELKEKYGNDPQRMNKETMKLYKEEGVNPVSGCLPQLLQMPLLFAIFVIFRNTIELRGAEFIFWIKDLSAPDTIYQLPFSIPFYGDLVNVLPIVMGATMFFQQKMTMKDPKQKAMVYFMPIFFTLLFNSFPSGLNLYYTLFNIFSIAQQKWTYEKKVEIKQEVLPKSVPSKKQQDRGSKSKRK